MLNTKNILFDLGGVLIDLDIRRSLDAFGALLAPEADLRHAAISPQALLGGHDSGLIDRYQTGEITTDEFIRSILSVCRPGTTPDEVITAWHAMLLGIPAERQQLLRTLADRGYSIYVLSNIRRLFFSNEIHLSKPDPRCFSLVVRETGIRPEETLYIDDLLPNIEAGRAAGFRTLHVPDGLPDTPTLLQILEGEN